MPASLKAAFHRAFTRTHVLQQRCRLLAFQTIAGRAGQRIGESRLVPPLAAGEYEAPVRRGVGSRHNVVEEREPPAAAIKQKRVVAQVIVVIPDQDIERHATEQLPQVGTGPGAKPAYGLGKIAVGVAVSCDHEPTSLGCSAPVPSMGWLSTSTSKERSVGFDIDFASKFSTSPRSKPYAIPMSSIYADITGVGAVTAAKMAVEDFGGKADDAPRSYDQALHTRWSWRTSSCGFPMLMAA